MEGRPHARPHGDGPLCPRAHLPPPLRPAAPHLLRHQSPLNIFYHFTSQARNDTLRSNPSARRVLGVAGVSCNFARLEMRGRDSTDFRARCSAPPSSPAAPRSWTRPSLRGGARPGPSAAALALGPSVTHGGQTLQPPGPSVVLRMGSFEEMRPTQK